ncbi:MAG: translation initiation factor IF-2 [Candidatus Liptonbacteria bacterium]
MPETNTQSHNRPPIVVVMGHVDHGKTTLLDYIRKTNVAGHEAGGITQAIGAYEITHGGRRMTFIDTPGHEAFSQMRSRGAHIADLAILVVAADEGVKPQTQESIKVLTETKTPFVVAVTKIDKPGADVEKVKNELMSANVYLEGCGGNVSYQTVSAKSGDHIGELLDLLLLAADLDNLEYDPLANASGFVLEARIDRQRGLEATVIVTNGILRQGDPILTKSGSGKIKILENFLGKAVKEIMPSAPALIIGFERLPGIGEEFSSGKEICLKSGDARAERKPITVASSDHSPQLLRVLIKASDSGSLEALYEIVKAMSREKPVKIIGDAVGDVNDNDVKFAIPSGAMIVSFKSRTEKGAKTLAEANKIKIVSSEIIYDLIKTIEDTVTELGRPRSAGELEVLAVFNQTKPEKQVIGGKIVHGTIREKAVIQVERNGTIVGTGRIISLQQQKKDVHQASEGEAGLIISANTLFAVGDKLVIA